MPPVLRRAIAVYEAARVMLGYITPGYDEVSQVRAGSRSVGYCDSPCAASASPCNAAELLWSACDYGNVVTQLGLH